MADSPNPMAAQVLIIEDEVPLAEALADALRRPGHVCTLCHTVDRALDELKHGTFDVIVTDLRMPGSGGTNGVAPDGSDAGLVVLRTARKLQPHAECIMVTAHGDVQTTRAAFKEGVRDFIEKPVDATIFRKVVSDAAEQVLMRHEAARDGNESLVQHDGFEGIIAGSEPMRRILRAVRSVAQSNLPVLILGESGTGKELIAQAVHRNSPRVKARFVALNCAAETETLLEDQLFGHVRGAFTGAEKDREGVFEYANHGTLFLDEIGDMPLKMQAKLLRVLETGRVVRVGSNDERQTDVRLVSATNKDLKTLIARGEFREDLYFRIKGAEVTLPPLRDRREDIPRIVNHALARSVGKALPKEAAVPNITDAAMMRLSSYDWPGNVRQLLNVVQNMVVSAIGEAEDARKPLNLDARHVPEDVRVADAADAGELDGGSGAGAGGSLAGTPLEQIEKRAIRETLKMYAGNRELTAKALGIGERTLYRKLREFGLR